MVSITSIEIRAQPEGVFAVLADPHTYPNFVVGDKGIREVEHGFPAVGAKFHHRVGFGPLFVDDHTEVLDVDAPWRLELRGKTRPFATARIAWLLQPLGEDSTHVTMLEDAGDVPSRLAINALTDPLMALRNARTLRRLKAFVEAGGR
jgi:uncharacterized protein YndB with AHSA1/START domain